MEEGVVWVREVAAGEVRTLFCIDERIPLLPAAFSEPNDWTRDAPALELTPLELVRLLCALRSSFELLPKKRLHKALILKDFDLVILGVDAFVEIVCATFGGDFGLGLILLWE